MKHTITTIRNMSNSRVYLGGINVDPINGRPLNPGSDITYCSGCFPGKVYCCSDKGKTADVRMIEIESIQDTCPLDEISDFNFFVD